MCKSHGGTYEGNKRIDLAPKHGGGNTSAHVDPCLQKLAQALNDAGMRTANCCCGHGHQPSSIILQDGRYVVIISGHDEMQMINQHYPVDINGNAYRWEDPVV